MTSGKPLTNAQREEILRRRDEWPAVVARDLGISHRSVKRALKRERGQNPSNR